MNALPIFPYLEKICVALLSSPSRFLVLTAETAAGKSTAVPIALLSHVAGKIVMLEPRRIATVAIASRISELLGERVGQTAGYRLHLDSKISSVTRIEVITEAILTRKIQADPALGGISVVILDEFHERTVHADLCLAFLREVLSLRDDLYVIVMSATIDTERIATSLNAVSLSVPGRQWPVKIEYAPPPISAQKIFPFEEHISRLIRDELRGSGGTILVFLPGLAEITRVREAIRAENAEIFILHSSVPFDEQRKIFAEQPVFSATDSGNGKDKCVRRVILSSSIAETSITVPGVTTVIDSGLSRIGYFDIATGMDTLITGAESVFSATQRAGRAGRTSPGKCIRAWAESDVRISASSPEICRSDIMPLVLECALWGILGRDDLQWLDSPNPAAWIRARDLLTLMGALDSSFRITEKGRRMTGLGVHPRIAAVALEGNIDAVLRYVRYSDNPREAERFRADLVRRVSAALDGQMTSPKNNPESCAALSLLAGFPDRIARHTSDGVYQFPSGRLATVQKNIKRSVAVHPQWIVATDVDSGERSGLIRSFEELECGDAERWLSGRAEPSIEFTFKPEGRNGGGLRKTEILKYGKLILSERYLAPSSDDQALALCTHIRNNGVSALPWSPASKSFIMRARFWYYKQGFVIGTSLSDDGPLIDNLEDWFVPFITGDGMISDSVFLDALRYRCEVKRIDVEVPAQILLPSGVSRPLLYEELETGEGPIPILEIRIQDLFGCVETPMVMKEPVLLRLLSPARRPLQITRDLPGFWKNTWPQVIKEMKGRYPKHKWPENPLLPLK